MRVARRVEASYDTAAPITDPETFFSTNVEPLTPVTGSLKVATTAGASYVTPTAPAPGERPESAGPAVST